MKCAVVVRVEEVRFYEDFWTIGGHRAASGLEAEIANQVLDRDTMTQYPYEPQ